MIEQHYDKPIAPTERIKRPTISVDVWPTIDIAIRFIVCLISVGMGIFISARASNGMAVLAALACGGVIYSLLSPKSR